MGKELRNELKRLFKKNPTWRTPHFMIKDIDLYMSLIDDNGYNRLIIYICYGYLVLL